MPYKEGKKWRGVVKIGGKRAAQKLFDRKKDASDWEKDKRKMLLKGLKRHLGDMALGTLCAKYLDYSLRFSRITYGEKRTLCKRILTAWGIETPLSKITPEKVLGYLSERSRTQSNNAYNKDRKNLLAMWNWGMKILGIRINPMVHIDSMPHSRSPQYTPKTEDILRVLAVADRVERAFLDCYLQTGARRTEIFRWTWMDDINFEKRAVRLGTRKTRDGSMKYRWLDMSDDLNESLKWIYENRKFKESPHVWVDYHQGPNFGKPYKVRRRFLKGLCERAKVKPFGFHALRRYVASILDDKHKVSLKKIQIILGHSNQATTERYLQHIHGDMRETMNLLSIRSVPDSGTRKKEEVNSDES